MLVHKSLALTVVVAGALWVAPASAPSALEATPLALATESEIQDARASLPALRRSSRAFTREAAREAEIEVVWENAPAAEKEKIEENEEAYEDTNDPDIFEWLVNRISFYRGQFPK